MTAAAEIAAALRAARKEAGFSQRQLAETSGRAQQNISSYENNAKVPNVSTLLSLADALGYDVVLRRRDRPLHTEYALCRAGTPADGVPVIGPRETLLVLKGAGDTLFDREATDWRPEIQA